MYLVWKLLKKHISVPQFAGYLLANLFGMLIVLFGYQFYNDVIPVFTQQDTFMKSDYFIVTKRIGLSSALSSSSSTFTRSDIDQLAAQEFTERVGEFTSTEYKVNASMGVNGQAVLNSEIFLESVPDDFIDIPLNDWEYVPENQEVPIILPRTYINVYNFGFAQSHSLPKISEGLMGMIDLYLSVEKNDNKVRFKGKVIGFSNRLNTILVPQAFMEWSNSRFSPSSKSDPNRLLLKVKNPTDERISKFMERHGYDFESDRLDAEKATFFLRLIVVLVMIIGLIISILSLYILMLSIYLLVEKNNSKMENLLLIGYSPQQVATPYQRLTIVMNVFVLLMSLFLIMIARNFYMTFIYQLYPDINQQGMLPSVILGVSILIVVTLLNVIVIKRKVLNIWKNKG